MKWPIRGVALPLLVFARAQALIAAPAEGPSQTTPADAASPGAQPTKVGISPARQLFQHAKSLLEEGQVFQACAEFEASLGLQDGVGTRYNLADCWERLGRTASAHGMFTKVAELTRSAGQNERADEAEERAHLLEARLSRVQLRVQGNTDGLTIILDGDSLASDAANQAFAVDPGAHHLEAREPGRTPWNLSFEVPLGPVLVPVVILPLSSAPPTVAVPPTQPAAAAAPAVQAPPALPAEPEVDDSPDRPRRALMFGLAGVGVVGLAAAGTMTKDFISANDSAKAICPSGEHCSEADVQRHEEFVNDARRARNWIVITGAVGGSALLASCILWLTESDPDEAHASVRATPFATLDGTWGASIDGRF
jgi:hypothetical protein